MDYSDYSADDNADIRNCKFAFKCEKRWNDLKVISGGNKRIRFCDDCEKDVYRCRTDDQLKIAMKHNHCVAICFEDKSSHEKVEFVGEPAGDYDRTY